MSLRQQPPREGGGGDAQRLHLVVVEDHEPVRSGHRLEVDRDEHLSLVDRLVAAAHVLADACGGPPVDAAHRVAGLVRPHAREARWIGEEAGPRAHASPAARPRRAALEPAASAAARAARAGSGRSSLFVPRSKRSLTVRRTGPKVNAPRRRASMTRCRMTRSYQSSDHEFWSAPWPGRSLATSGLPATRSVSVTWSSAVSSGRGSSLRFQTSTSSGTWSPHTARPVPIRRS